MGTWAMSQSAHHFTSQFRIEWCIYGGIDLDKADTTRSSKLGPQSHAFGLAVLERVAFAFKATEFAFLRSCMLS